MRNKNCNSTKVKVTCLTSLLVSVFLLSALAGVQFIEEVAALEYTEYTGTLDGADFALRIPDPWNGMLVVICRGYSSTPTSPVIWLSFGSSMLNQEFAIAASDFGAVGQCVSKGVDSTYNLTRHIIDNYNVTGKVFLYGISMGGAVALLLGEKYPDVYSGVLDLAGPKDYKEHYAHKDAWANLNDTELTEELTALGASVPPNMYSSLESFRDSLVTGKNELELETGGTPATYPTAYEDISPTYHANITIPVITIHGTSDAEVLFSQSVMYQAAVANAGRSDLYRLYNVTGGEHMHSSVMAEVPARFDELVAWSNSLSPAVGIWSKTYGGTASESVEVFIQTSDGGYAMAGYTNSFGAGNYDFWLIKTDAAGNMQWNKTYGGTNIDYGFSVVQTSDGGYAMAGTKNNDFWLVKTDAAGNMQWNKTYGGTNNDWAFSVVQTSDGGYAMEGVTASFGAGGRDGWLVKTDADGNMQWNKTIGGTDNDFLYSLVTTSDGGYAVGGHTYSFGAGAEDYWLVKTDAAGNVQWNQTYGGTGTDFNYRLIQTVDGGYAMAGYTNSFGAGGRDCWLVKTDALGNMQWNQTYGGTGDDYGSRVLQTADGGYAMIGYTGSFGAGGQDFYVVKTDADGNMEWNMTYGGTGNEQGEMVIQTIDGGYAIAGNTNSFGAGGQDFWLVKTDELGVIPEGLTVGVMLLLSTVTAIVGIHYLRKRPK